MQDLRRLHDFVLASRARWKMPARALAARLARVEPEIRHHGRAGSRQLGRDHTGEGMRRVAVAPGPGQHDAREVVDVAHPIIDPHHIVHAGAGGLGNGCGGGAIETPLREQGFAGLEQAFTA